MTAREIFAMRARAQTIRRAIIDQAKEHYRRAPKPAPVVVPDPVPPPAPVVVTKPVLAPAPVLEAKPKRARREKMPAKAERRPVGRPRKPKPEKPQPPAGWRTVNDFAANGGGSSRSTILNGLKAGVIQSVKIGRERWFDPATLEEYRRRGKENLQENIRVALAAWADKHGAHRAPPGTMRVRDLARKYDRAEAGIYKAIRLGQLPSVKVGALRCVRPSDFEDYMARAKAVLSESAVRAYTAKMRKCAERKKESK